MQKPKGMIQRSKQSIRKNASFFLLNINSSKAFDSVLYRLLAKVDSYGTCNNNLKWTIFLSFWP